MTICNGGTKTVDQGLQRIKAMLRSPGVPGAKRGRLPRLCWRFKRGVRFTRNYCNPALGAAADLLVKMAEQQSSQKRRKSMARNIYSHGAQSIALWAKSSSRIGGGMDYTKRNGGERIINPARQQGGWTTTILKITAPQPKAHHHIACGHEYARTGKGKGFIHGHPRLRPRRC
jgi:hypothetical protein